MLENDNLFGLHATIFKSYADSSARRSVEVRLETPFRPNDLLKF